MVYGVGMDYILTKQTTRASRQHQAPSPDILQVNPHSQCRDSKVRETSINGYPCACWYTADRPYHTAALQHLHKAFSNSPSELYQDCICGDKFNHPVCEHLECYTGVEAVDISLYHFQQCITGWSPICTIYSLIQLSPLVLSLGLCSNCKLSLCWPVGQTGVGGFGYRLCSDWLIEPAKV